MDPTSNTGNSRTVISVRAAQEVLRNNCVEGRTRASLHLYPHQWNWDAGFVARGYLHFDPEQAYREIRLLFEGQWSDGFLPHMIFNEQHLDHFPGPDYWKAERSGRVPDGMHTSGISQPPVHASMLVAAPELDPDKDRAHDFLEEMYPRIRSLHDFFFTHRDPAGEGLVTLVHPWESGIDNAPIWDEPLAVIEESSPWAKDMQARYDALAEEGKRPKRSYIEKYSTSWKACSAAGSSGTRLPPRIRSGSRTSSSTRSSAAGNGTWQGSPKRSVSTRRPTAIAPNGCRIQ